ncbi:MAG: type II secretion system protein [Sulfurimonas sp.]|nr:type II secretion system protein [Sulfurimonas sp.]
MKLISTHKAFTMIELIFVIVIMGIISKFGAEFLAQAYKSFIFSKINYDLQTRSEAAVEIISKRLEHRIKRSVIARNTNTNTYNSLTNNTLSDDDATVLEWIATDIEGFHGTNQPLWSGVIDLNASTAIRLISPGTNLNAVSAQISNLSYDTADINNTAIYFINSFLTSNPWGYNGAILDQNQTLHPIIGANTNELWPQGSSFAGQEVYEYYKLAWTAYAIELGDYNETTKIGNLYLYYNYRPWEGDTYADDGTKVLLAENINTFRYRAAGSLIKIQVCAKSDLINEEYALCKEKTVY